MKKLLLLAITAFSLSACQSSFLIANNTVTPKTKLLNRSNIIDFGKSKNNISIPVNLTYLNKNFNTKAGPVAPRIKDDIKSISFSMCDNPSDPLNSLVTPEVFINIGLNFIGDETQINTTTTGTQNQPVIASDAEGNYVIVWSDQYQDGNGYGIFAQRYDSFGTPIGSEIQINTTISSDQANPSVSMNKTGDFIVAWDSLVGDGNTDVFASRYDKLGNLIGTEFQVNTYTPNLQSKPSVAISDNGSFVIAWQSNLQDSNGFGIFAQKYDNNANTISSEIQVNSNTVSDQLNPSVGIDGAGDFVVAWDSNQSGNKDIYYRRFNYLGNPFSIDALVNTSYQSDIQSNPSISVNSIGNFIITWQSNGQDGNSFGVFAQKFNKSGILLGSQFQVNTETTNSQSNPSIAMNDEGSFVVTWDSYLQDGDMEGVYSKLYKPDGSVEKDEFLMNSYTTSSQSNPSVAMSHDGNFVTTWQSYAQDGDTEGIYAQMYGKKNKFILKNPPEGTLSAVVVAYDDLDGMGNNITDFNKFIPTDQFNISSNSVTIDSSLNISFNPSTPEALQIPINLISTTAVANDFQINTDTEYNKSEPAMSLDEAGNGMIVWMGETGTANEANLWAKEVRNFVPFGEDIKINTSSLIMAHEPSISMKSGKGIIVWTENNGSYNIIKGQKILGYKAYGSPFTVSSTTENNKNPDVKISNKDGNGIVTWIKEPNTLMYRSVLDATTESSPSEIMINNTGSLASSARISLDRFGNGMIVYVVDGEILYSTITNFIPSPTNSAYTPDYSTYYDAGTPNISLNESGNGMIVFDGNSPGTGQVLSIKVEGYTPLSTNQIANYATTSMFNDGSAPVVSLSNGNGIVIWSREDSNVELYALPVMNGFTGGSPQPVTESNYGKIRPIVQVKPNGNALIVWEYNGNIYGFHQFGLLSPMS